MSPDEPVILKLRPLPGRPPLPLPHYATAQAAGMDLVSAESCNIAPGRRALVGTGLSIELPEGFEAQVRPRSGLAAKFGVTVLNSPGTIDADYRGEIKVILINHGEEPFEVSPGDRIAQMVIAPVSQAEIHLVTSLGESARGGGGFGHTGR